MIKSWSGGVPMIEFFAERGQHLLIHHLTRPTLCPQEEVVRLLWVDEGNQFLTHVLMREAERVPGFMTNHTMVLAFVRVHRETLEVQGRPVTRDMQDVGAEIGPISSLIPRDAHLPHTAGLHERDPGGLVPGIHVRMIRRRRSGGPLSRKLTVSCRGCGPQYLSIRTEIAAGVSTKTARHRAEGAEVNAVHGVD